MLNELRWIYTATRLWFSS